MKHRERRGEGGGSRNQELGLGQGEGKLGRREPSPFGFKASAFKSSPEKRRAPWQSPLAPFLERMWGAEGREKLAS